MNDKVFTKKWIEAAGIRALKTMAQTALSLFTVGMAIEEVQWTYVISVSITAGIYSLVTSLSGLPELETENKKDGYDNL